ncbi:30S ribosomal protein S8 [Candidatus Micrarchaeota archaeon]|nr:30S ribosomal protein S8 [Candidatus Micrarchaeota archaeon]
MDLLANALNQIKIAERKGLRTVRIEPTNKLVRDVLNVLKSAGYIADAEFSDDARGGRFVVTLNGAINECGVIKPRFPVGKKTWEKFEQRFLPSKDIGVLIVTTPQGVVTHNAAKEKLVGGRLLAYAF